MNNVICHIVGVSNINKEEIVGVIKSKYPDIKIKDLDLISKKINKDKQITKYWNKWEKCNAQNKKQECKEIKKKMLTLWKQNFESLVNKIMKAHNKLIFIGFSHHTKDNRTFVKISTQNKFFFKSTSEKYSKESIEHYLDRYKKHIIDGIFPLKYLDLNFLMKKYDSIKNLYSRQNYSEKTLKNILKTIDSQYKEFNKLKDVKKIFVGSGRKIDDVIKPGKNKEIIGYTQEWLSLVSIPPQANDKIRKGFVRERPFLQEKVKNGMSVFNRKGYLYQVDPHTFRFVNDKNPYKLVSTLPAKINKGKGTYVANIYKKLHKLNIDIQS